MKSIESFIDRLAAAYSGLDEAGILISRCWSGEESGLFLSRFKETNDRLAAVIKTLNEIEEQLDKD